MRGKRRLLIGALAVLSVTTLSAGDVVSEARASTPDDRTLQLERTGETVFPFDGALKYPFTKRASQKCGRWRSTSQDYPYFGAPRDGTARRHGGIDLYPLRGEGASIKAIQDGTVIRRSPFYKRASGEMTYSLLVDHRNYVANYAELREPVVVPGAAVTKGQIIGFVSGTGQLHLELYTPGTRSSMSWSWYGRRPANLIDPTDLMTKAQKARRPSPDLAFRSKPAASGTLPIIR